MFCQNCGKEMLEDSLFCPECGAKVEQQPVVQPVTKTEKDENGATKSCENCGCQIPADSRFCPECRTSITVSN